MGVNFQFATSSKIIFGDNTSRLIPGLIKERGNRLLVVTGENTKRLQPLLEKISLISETNIFKVVSEPTTGTVNTGVEIAREMQCNLVLGIGGGSVIDSAKAIAALAPNRGELLNYLEVIGAGKPLTEKPIQCIAVPTTSGTGAEVTKNSVIKSERHKVKVSLRSDLMYPDIALSDPVLTHSLPPGLTASTGMDALTHLLEAFTSCQSNAFVDMFCREGMARVAASLKIAFANGHDLKAREDMALASMLGGIALANVKLGAVHGFAGPLGGMATIPHGVVCASLLPAVMEININALKAGNKSEGLAKYGQAAKILSGKNNAIASDGVAWVRELVSELGIPCLSAAGIKPCIFPELIEKAKKSSSMKGNPVVLNSRQLEEILVRSL